MYYKSMGKIFVAQGQVTLKLMVQTGSKLNSSEILWLSLLRANIQSKKKKRDNKECLLDSHPLHSNGQ